MPKSLTSHLGHCIIQFHILLCNLPAILDRCRFLLESIGFNLTYTVSDMWGMVDVPLSTEAWLTQTTEFRAAAAGWDPHIGLPMTGWTVGIEPFASPIFTISRFGVQQID